MRLRLTLTYAGTTYAGWQRQPAAPTVQGTLEAALSRLCAASVQVTGASRTDAGVHALGQVAHADVDDRGADDRGMDWQRALNALLPADVRVLRAERAAADFHARHDAICKSYVYCIDPAPLAMPMLAPWCWHVPEALDLQAMRAAAARLLGGIDQRSFATRPEARHRERPLQAIDIEAGRVITVTVRGRSFLRHAVRGMVGALVAVGEGHLAADRLGELARRGDRAALPPPAPAHGLCLARVDYATPAC